MSLARLPQCLLFAVSVSALARSLGCADDSIVPLERDTGTGDAEQVAGTVMARCRLSLALEDHDRAGGRVGVRHRQVDAGHA